MSQNAARITRPTVARTTADKRDKRAAERAETINRRTLRRALRDLIVEQEAAR